VKFHYLSPFDVVMFSLMIFLSPQPLHHAGDNCKVTSLNPGGNPWLLQVIAPPEKAVVSSGLVNAMNADIEVCIVQFSRCTHSGGFAPNQFFVLQVSGFVGNE